TLLPQHPRIRELRAQLGGLEGQIRAAAERAARAMATDARAAGARVAASQAELDQQKRLSGAANEQEVQLRVLEREAKAEREQLENYLARYRDASVRNIENAAAADARIISRATVPSAPTFPKRLPIIIIATLAAFTLSLFLVLTKALLSDRIYVASGQVAPAYLAPAAIPQPMMAAPVAAAPIPAAPVMAAPVAADPLQQSLRRMREALQPRPAAEPDGHAAAPVAAADAGPAIIPDAPAMADPGDFSVGYDALGEIADAADAAKLHGRPVVILLLSVQDSAYAEGTAERLAARLRQKGSVTRMALDPDLRTQSHLSGVIRSMAGMHDFVVLNAGKADTGSPALTKAAAITVLVASEDLLDPHFDAASRNLEGCNYFIVGAAPAADVSA
ncbi:MAG: GNVR domain-containing protein, partial [Beijerinckiaceae bacterium]